MEKCGLYLPLWQEDMQGSSLISYDPAHYVWSAIGTTTWGQQGRLFDSIDDWLGHATKANFDWMHGAVDATGFQWTVLVWVKLTNPESDTRQFYFANTAANTTNVGVAVYFDDRSSTGDSRRLELLIVNGSDYLAFLISADNVYPNDTASHLLAFTYNQAPATGNANIYVDSALVATGNKSANEPSAATSTRTPHIGIDGSEAAVNAFGGVMGEMTILRRELLLPEIQNYQQTTRWRYQ